MLAILSMHEIARVFYLVLNQQPKTMSLWWTFLQMRAIIPDFIDLILVSLSLIIGPSLFFAAYNILKLSLLFPLLLEGFLVKDKAVDERWSLGLVIYCSMIILNIFMTGVMVLSGYYVLD